MQADVRAVAGHFVVPGELVGGERYGGGHINDSFLLTFRHGSKSARYLLQRINAAVFPRPLLVMENIRRVTEHIARKLVASGVRDADRRVLSLVRTRGGEPYHRDPAGSVWRLYPFIERTRVHQAVEAPAQAIQAGRAFGTFQQQLADLPGPRLHEAIPDFHNTPLRYEALDRAIRVDPCGRAAAARAEIEFAQRHRGLAGLLLDLHRAGHIPERIVHNDTKISNVLFDAETGEALCVTDLDTVMPGLTLYDFGDMARSMSTTAAEDERDPSRVRVELPLFEALVRGYVETARAFLTPAERAQLVFAGKLITLEQALRFLTDFLSGDTYYKTTRPAHNLDRCRTQFALFQSIERNEAHLRRFIERL